MRTFFSLLGATYREWSEDRAERLGAALAYYMLFSLGPLLIVAIAIAGAVFGEAAARGQIVSSVQGAIGPDAARAIEALIANVHTSRAGVLATIVGAALLLIGASNVFGQLKDALNTIWDIQPWPAPNLAGNLLHLLRDRLLSLLMVFSLGVLLLAALAMNTGITALRGWLAAVVPGTSFVWQGGNLVIGFLVATLLFAAIYKVLPDASVAWRELWIGTSLTAVLFSLGAFAIGLYLGRSEILSVYGAAGSLISIVLWVYYSAQIFFFGAEFMQVLAEKRGAPIQAARGAVRVTRSSR